MHFRAACLFGTMVTASVYQNALIDKAEREAEAEQTHEAESKVDWSTLDAKNQEQTRALRKKLDLQQKLKAKQAAAAPAPTEEEEAAAKEAKSQLVAEAIKTIEGAEEKPQAKGPKIKLAEKMMVTSEGDMTKEETTRLQAMVGAGKSGKLKAFFQQTGQTREIDESEVKDDEVVTFAGCKDCDYTLSARCTKVFVEHCENFMLRLTGKILTDVVELDACEKMNLVVHTKIGTLQVERCNKTNILFGEKAHFSGFMIWAGCFMLRLQVEELVMNCDFGLTQKLDPTINIERTQFKVWTNSQGKLTCDKVIRLENGFPSTKREDDEHERRKEEKLNELAKRMGVNVHRKEGDVGGRVKPNEPCPCGSGQKYKKCCLNGGTRLAAQPIPEVAVADQPEVEEPSGSGGYVS